jgi:hypothetical protein
MDELKFTDAQKKAVWKETAGMGLPVVMNEPPIRSLWP